MPIVWRRQTRPSFTRHASETVPAIELCCMRNNNLEVLLAAVGIGLVTYGISQHPKCDEICRQVFGSAASEAGKIFASTAIAMITAQSVQPTRTSRRA